VGEGVDTLAFIAIASLFRVFPWELFWTLVLTNYLFKVGIEALMTPVTYLVVARLKHSEQEDFYDTHTNFTPFKVS
jgi:queuosine precursor transporter